MTDGNYQLYAVIDYSGEEVHKTRDLTTDPGGNNEGYFDFSVENVISNNILTEMLNNGDNEDISGVLMTYNGKQTWNEFFNEYVANTTGPVYLTVKITNNMPHTLHDTEIKAVYKTEQSADEETVFVKNITLFPKSLFSIFEVVYA